MVFFAFIKRYPILFLSGFAICCVLLGISLGIHFHDELLRARCQALGGTFIEINPLHAKTALESDIESVGKILNSWAKSRVLDPCELGHVLDCYVDLSSTFYRILEVQPNVIFDETFVQQSKTEE